MPARSSRWYEKVAIATLVIMGLLTFVFGVSAVFVDEPLVDSLTGGTEALRGEIEAFEHDANVLIATFAPGMALFGWAITLTALRRGERCAWSVMWYYPVFFVLHVVSLGTVVPDLPLAVLSALALLALAPRAWSPRSARPASAELATDHG